MIKLSPRTRRNGLGRLPVLSRLTVQRSIDRTCLRKGDYTRMAKKTAKVGKKLVIVESPAKAKTINKYLGDDYVVRASMGHVRDLPSKGMGVDLETFVPEYEVLESRGKVIKELKQLSKTAEMIYLATDLDREGEAIAWHLKEALG